MKLQSILGVSLSCIGLVSSVYFLDKSADARKKADSIKLEEIYYPARISSFDEGYTEQYHNLIESTKLRNSYIEDYQKYMLSASVSGLLTALGLLASSWRPNKK